MKLDIPDAPPLEVPCRVDFAGGWLDLPALAIEGAYVVNCAISPLVSLAHWPYRKNAGVGGGAAWSALRGLAAADAESGWQDAAVILETGLCVWRSGPKPVLEFKANPDFLHGLMALWYSGKPHCTDDLLSLARNYHAIRRAADVAVEAVKHGNLTRLAEAINQTHNAQLEEGMPGVPSALRSIAYKYVGSGHGGYVLYLFHSPADRDLFCAKPEAMAIEPYLNGKVAALEPSAA